MTIDLRELKYSSFSSHLECPVCQIPFIKPYVTKCGHTFCFDCLSQMLPLTSFTCPLDKVDLTSSESSVTVKSVPVQISPAPLVLKSMCDDVEVECPEQNKGCFWKGPRCDAQSHADECKPLEAQEAHEAQEAQQCENSELGCDAKGSHACKYEAIARKFRATNSRTDHLHRRFSQLINSVPYLYSNPGFVDSSDGVHVTPSESVYVKQLIVDNRALRKDLSFLSASVATLQVQMSQLKISQKVHVLQNERQRMMREEEEARVKL